MRRPRQHIRDAVRRGHLIKPSQCEDCGADVEERKLSGHHADYSKTMRVKWLCHSCHHKANVRAGQRVNQHG